MALSSSVTLALAITVSAFLPISASTAHANSEPLKILQQATSHAAAKPQKIALSGGLLHASGFFFNATIGGQHFTLQVDISYSSLVLPHKGCEGCRVGDRRYDPAQSKKSRRIACADRECRSVTEDKLCSSKVCHNCASDGQCCVEKGTDCAFNILYGDASSGNGTLFEDELQIADLSATVLFGGMYAESHGFELPYADGVFGLAFQKGACRPTCFTPLMDSIVNQTDIADIFTMCVSRYGGTLMLGAADDSLAHGPYAFVDVVEDERDNRFITSALPTWKVGTRDLQLPDITRAMWTVSMSGIGMSKTSFLVLLEHLTSFYCEIPGLCSTTSWFRPLHCAPLPDSVMQKMPNLTLPLTKRVNIVLTPYDYLIPFREIGGHMHRCVAFVASDSLAKHGVGLLLGSTVMSRYAVAMDRKGRRVGLALAKQDGECGPTSGSDEGLPGAPGVGGTVLTADAPAAPAGTRGGSGGHQPALFAEAETCRAESSCSGCARLRNCSYSYDNGRCIPIKDAGRSPYPFCSGAVCACFAVGPSGWYVGIGIGVLVAIAVAVSVAFACRKRQRRNVYQVVDGYEEQDLETF